MASQRNEPDRHGSPSSRDGSGMALRDAAKHAVRGFTGLLGQDVHGVTGARKTDHGWSVLVDVIELERIPQSTSLVATYRVDIDAQGELVSYERLRRFTLGATDQS